MDIPVISLISRPRIVRQIAAQQSEIATIVVNALNGIVFTTALAMLMLPFFTPSLVILIGVLFGPLAGFVISSLYPRLEFTAGARLRGKATLDDIYRIFAWSFLPIGFAALLYSFILMPFKKPGITTTIILAIPSLIMACFAIRNYCSNIVAVQQFTRKRGAFDIVLTFILFLIVIGGGVGILSLLTRYYSGDSLSCILH